MGFREWILQMNDITQYCFGSSEDMIFEPRAGHPGEFKDEWAFLSEFKLWKASTTSLIA